MKSRAIKIFYKLHRWTGLFMALHFILLSTTGSILVFREEISGVASEHEVAENISSAQVILEKAKSISPTSRPLSLNFKNEDTIELRLGVNNSQLYRQSHRLYFSTEGEEKELLQKEADWMNWILRLHRELLLGSNGKIYIGLIGIVYCFTLISGFLIYGPFHKKLGFGEIRRSNQRQFFGDLHKYLGIVTLCWGLIIGMSGAFLGLSSTLIKVFQYHELQFLNQKYPVKPNAPWISIDSVLTSAQKALPESKFEFLAFPDTQFSPPGHFLVLFHGSTPLTEKLIDLVVVDSISGEVTDIRPLPWYLKLTLISEPLHFGNYGGLGLKLIWSTFNLAALALPILGVLIWRRKNKVTSGTETAYLLSELFSGKENYILLTGVTGILGSFFLEGPISVLFGLMVTLPAALVLFVVKLLKKRPQ